MARKSKKPAKPKLSDRQRAFVREYVLDSNANQAAIRAGYSAATCGTQGPRLLRNVHIRAAVERAFQRKQARADLTIDLVLERLEQNYHMALSLQHSAAANQAVTLMGRHLGMFVEKHEHEVKHNLSDLLAGARARRRRGENDG